MNTEDLALTHFDKLVDGAFVDGRSPVAAKTP